MRDESHSSGQVVKFNGHLVMSGTVAGWFFSLAEEGRWLLF